MKYPLFTQVALREDIPEYGLKKGSVATIVEYYPMPEGEEDGYSLEGLLFQDTVEVAQSQIEALPIPVAAGKGTLNWLSKLTSGLSRLIARFQGKIKNCEFFEKL